MIEDDVLKQVRAAREEYARLHDFDVRKIVADLQRLNEAGDWPVIRSSARRAEALATPSHSTIVDQKMSEDRDPILRT